MTHSRSLFQRFMRYLLPSVAGMLVSSLYIVVDGIFVGRGVGAVGLAAINLVWPYIAVYTAIMMMAAVGGAALCSHAQGAGDSAQAQRCFSQALWLLLLPGAALALIAFFLPGPISQLLGANADTLPYCIDYLRWYMSFGLANALAIGLAAFVRNDGAPALAFWSMVVGSLLNILFDYLAIIVLGYGMIGAAVASGMGQLVCVMILLPHFLRRKDGHLRLRLALPNPKLLRSIAYTGTPELLVNLCSPVSLIAYNYALMHYIGANGVAAYGIVAYILTILSSLFIGVSQGIQPLLCYSMGAGDTNALRRVFRLGLWVNMGLATLLLGLLMLFRGQVIGIFTTDAALAEMTAQAFVLYAPSCLFAAVNVVCITYCLSIQQTRFANLLSFSRGVLLILLFIAVLPQLLGTAGIWLTITAAEGVTLAVALVGFRKIQ